MKKRIALSVTYCLLAGILSAAIFDVTKTSDDPVDGCDADCSLREAVIAANATVVHDTVVVPAGTYVLNLGGAGEDSAATGDLDLIYDVTIVGDPAGGTIIDGDLADRLVHLNGATVTLEDLVLTRGSTTGDFYGAGGILVESGALTMTRCLLSDCVSDGHGGGLFSLGAVFMDQCTVTGNTGHNGGGIYHAGSALTLSNCTVSGNTATTYGAGGVDSDGLAANAIIFSCTISANQGADADAVSVLCPFYIASTVLDGSCEIVNGMGWVTSEGGNLESPGDTCGLIQSIDQTSVSVGELNLGPLQDNGGNTPTHALLAGSFAIDAGNNATCQDTDQRGWLRHDGSCDVGAFELGATEPLLFADGFDSGSTSAWSATVP